MRADLFGNLWILIIVIYLIATVIAGIRRSAARLSRSSREAATTIELAAAKQVRSHVSNAAAALAAPAVAQTPVFAQRTIANISEQAPSASAGPNPPVREALVEALTQMLRAQTADQAAPLPSTPTPSMMMPSAMLPRATLPPTLQLSDLSITPTPASGELMHLTPPMHAGVAAELTALIARLNTPSGLAFAIVAAAIVGTPPALRTQPQEPGGW